MGFSTIMNMEVNDRSLPILLLRNRLKLSDITH